MFIKVSAYNTYNCQSLSTLTLYAPMVVSRVDRVLLLARLVGEEEGVYSTYKYQVPTTLTLYAPTVVP